MNIIVVLCTCMILKCSSTLYSGTLMAIFNFNECSQMICDILICVNFCLFVRLLLYSTVYIIPLCSPASLCLYASLCRFHRIRHIYNYDHQFSAIKPKIRSPWQDMNLVYSRVHINSDCWYRFFHDMLPFDD